MSQNYSCHRQIKHPARAGGVIATLVLYSDSVCKVVLGEWGNDKLAVRHRFVSYTVRYTRRHRRQRVEKLCLARCLVRYFQFGASPGATFGHQGPAPKPETAVSIHLGSVSDPERITIPNRIDSLKVVYCVSLLVDIWCTIQTGPSRKF